MPHSLHISHAYVQFLVLHAHICPLQPQPSELPNSLRRWKWNAQLLRCLIMSTIQSRLFTLARRRKRCHHVYQTQNIHHHASKSYRLFCERPSLRKGYTACPCYLPTLVYSFKHNISTSAYHHTPLTLNVRQKKCTLLNRLMICQHDGPMKKMD